MLGLAFSDSSKTRWRWGATDMRIHRTTAAVIVSAGVLVSVLAGGSSARQERISGTVIDEATNKPIQGAWVVSAHEVTRTNQEGRFELDANTEWVGARALGYSRRRVDASAKMQIGLQPLRIHGLYLSFWGVGSSVLRNEVLETTAKANLNALVIDFKGDRGLISSPTRTAEAVAAGANKTITMPDPVGLLTDLHRRGLYAIARIVVFKDDPLARRRPDLAVKTATGTLFVDREGLAWTDPFNRTVWQYNIALALEAARAGFDEVQFDYVRFPDQKGLQFSQPNTEANRREAIAGFLAEARRALAPENVFVSADNFGYVCWNLDDTGIGQCFADLAPVIDYISPMLYPSAFQFGIPGVRNPMSDPYRIVFASLQRAVERTSAPPHTFRPWLQAFNDYAFDHRQFGKRELEEQIRAAQDAHADGWLLWNPRNRYDGAILAELSARLWCNEDPHTRSVDKNACFANPAVNGNLESQPR